MEVELRARIKDKSEIEKSLLKLGCEKQGSSYMVDEYFQLINPDEQNFIYRIRVKNEEYIFTLKKGGIGAWMEKEINISNPTIMKNILLNSNFENFLTIKKDRMKFSFKNMNINLDDLEDVGEFIEVEIICDDADKGHSQIQEFLIGLGIKKEDIIKKGYVRMLTG